MLILPTVDFNYVDMEYLTPGTFKCLLKFK